MMPNKLEYRFALWGVILTCVVGGIIGLVGYRQMTRSVHHEAIARVAEATRAGQRLLEVQFARLDPGGLLPPNAKRTTVLAKDIRQGTPLYPLVQTALADTNANAFALLPDGLSIVSVRYDPDAKTLSVATLPLRGANWLPDQIRTVVFGRSEGKQNSTTVTIFEKDIRIATNVRLPDGRRATGTHVSEEVNRRVLKEGRPWNDRAFVVDRWVISSYLPIRTVDGAVVGMLYTGIDESSYVAQQERSIFLFVVFILGLTLVVSATGWHLGRHLACPLTKLTGASIALSREEREYLEISAKDPEEIRLLADAFNRMADRIQAKTVALQTSNRQAKKALDDYMEVLGFVAHELKSPVAGALTQLAMIDDGYVGEVPEKLQQPLAAIRRYMEYGHEMALSFNNLSRIESDGFALQKKPLADFCQAVISPAIADLSLQASQRKMAIVLKGTPVPGQADLDLMRVVMDNLIGNAIKYGRSETEICVTVDRIPKGIHVEVRNQGVGVPSERYPELFQKFHRIQDSKLTSRKGTGVGLYLVKKIIDLHGGQVGVDGKYEEWIAFWFEIPDGNDEPQK